MVARKNVRRNAMRLIDADRLKAEIMGWCVVTDDLFGMGKYHEREIVLQAIEESPAIDAVPVMRGEWIENPTKDSVLCSYCHADWNLFDNDTYRFCYCPNCGAKMEVEHEN